ncbi:MAG: response regulator [Chloroflexota bacterium]
MLDSNTAKYASSVKGYGVRTTLTYPGRYFENARANSSPASRTSAGSESNIVIDGRDVLVVEDEPYLCDLIVDVIEAEGHSARKAGNGRVALQRLEESKPRLILLDLMMPVMDGWEFIAALRSNPRWLDIPVVIITAVYDVARTQKETGAQAVITKPFDIEQLADVVNYYSA